MTTNPKITPEYWPDWFGKDIWDVDKPSDKREFRPPRRPWPQKDPDEERAEAIAKQEEVIARQIADAKKSRAQAAAAKKREAAKRQRELHKEICRLVAAKQIMVTEAYIRSITDPKQKQELVEAICLSKV